MSRLRPDALTVTQNVLRVLIVLNLGGVAVALLILASYSFSEPFLREVYATKPEARIANVMFRLRAVTVIAICSVPFTHVVLKRLLAIVQTVGRGDPFVSDNAARLRIIAWALLGMQALQVAAGAIQMTGTRTHLAGASLSVTPWVAVLLLFVLARVFQRGTQMRDELEGTV